MFNEKELQLIVNALNLAPLTGLENHTLVGPIVQKCQLEANRIAEETKEKAASEGKQKE